MRFVPFQPPTADRSSRHPRALAVLRRRALPATHERRPPPAGRQPAALAVRFATLHGDRRQPMDEFSGRSRRSNAWTCVARRRRREVRAKNPLTGRCARSTGGDLFLHIDPAPLRRRSSSAARARYRRGAARALFFSRLSAYRRERARGPPAVGPRAAIEQTSSTKSVERPAAGEADGT